MKSLEYSIEQVEQISQMAYFAEALLDYHSQCTEILKTLVETMQEKSVNFSFVIDFKLKENLFTDVKRPPNVQNLNSFRSL